MWIADKIQNGIRPIVRVIDQGSNRNDAMALEQERINMHIASGHNYLTNGKKFQSHE